MTSNTVVFCRHYRSYNMSAPQGAPDAIYGFIGLGNMGFGMAKNVRQKIPSTSKLIVCELVKSQRDEFCSTVEGHIETAESPKDIAERCVCMYSTPGCPLKTKDDLHRVWNAD